MLGDLPGITATERAKVTKTFLISLRLLVKNIISRIPGNKPGSFKSFRETVPSRLRLKGVENQRLSRTLKNCPNCRAQVPLSALLCNSCDHNFLVDVHRHKLLNPPRSNGARRGFGERKAGNLDDTRLKFAVNSARTPVSGDSHDRTGRDLLALQPYCKDR